MSESASGEQRQPFRRQKILDRAVVLPLVGLVLLMPPIADIFQIELRIMGIPFTAIYVFVVWGALIAAAAPLARLLGEYDEAGTGEPIPDKPAAGKPAGE